MLKWLAFHILHCGMVKLTCRHISYSIADVHKYTSYLYWNKCCHYHTCCQRVVFSRQLAKVSPGYPLHARAHWCLSLMRDLLKLCVRHSKSQHVNGWLLALVLCKEEWDFYKQCTVQAKEELHEFVMVAQPPVRRCSAEEGALRLWLCSKCFSSLHSPSGWPDLFQDASKKYIFWRVNSEGILKQVNFFFDEADTVDRDTVDTDTVDTDTVDRIQGVAAQMTKFDFFFGVSLRVVILSTQTT